MSFINFGQFAEAIRGAQQANANRNTTPMPVGINIPASANTSADAAVIRQVALGSNNEFLWGRHTWDDMEHQVTT